MINAQITVDSDKLCYIPHMKPQILHVHSQAPFLKQPQIQIQQNLSLKYPHILG